MKVQRKRRLILVIGLIGLVAIAAGLTLYALRSNINLFFTPSEVVAGKAPYGRTMRMGGLVKEDSVVRESDSLEVSFVVTDFAEDVSVRYDDILPDLFREGQGVVVIGRLHDNGKFIAQKVLAKHDEKYMPPEVAEALEATGNLPDRSEETSG
ncbi:cytochrome c maturation protein CcmE [Chromohalobacter japonicus]|uniref:cytochrome c maturation protein CcmE n=1 Tax=Chromohalobacter japonicus TaxID=223900 RepID=UPI001FF67F94|nr:cytochrome c maturation protein CcmE [Chromohalobacter japonicus]MCK0754296.1 cytochrome c maturation protein CcmE [Chromohalobacter japonicus]